MAARTTPGGAAPSARTSLGPLLVLLVAVVGAVAWMSQTAPSVSLPGPGPTPVAGPGQPVAAGEAPDAAVPPEGARPDPPASASPVEAPTRLAEDGAGEAEAPVPTGVRIPAIGVDARSIELGLRDDGRLQVPADAAVTGWWTGGARPGEAGPAVVVGHVDSRRGRGVFADLRRLAVGDRVLIDRADGTTAHFAVQLLERHRKDAFPTSRVYGPTRSPTLRLITCGGAFDRRAGSYEDNLVVYLGLVGWS
ncbi:class F sortase [Nitriliruptoraceae bacterium ZYF776]|nr:class F sortase [Profundirhabdus halotolerans]